MINKKLKYFNLTNKNNIYFKNKLFKKLYLKKESLQPKQ
ncbi:hypothetical protein ACI8B_30257 [Acinetobacter proteolyticus]|uniref:Uncharacterized protein n=1 Tax=Acinetobacter proteolyticus TaxID=1776741 RepID=A0A653K7Q1_9GAMM|nr:hypothetical protein ACI8B_30257 [Acinetobacter proteolyticus]